MMAQPSCGLLPIRHLLSRDAQFAKCITVNKVAWQARLHFAICRMRRLPYARPRLGGSIPLELLIAILAGGLA
jgi:hypothetical protein